MSDKYDDERLFKFFVEHGYFPRDYEENKVLKKDINFLLKMRLDVMLHLLILLLI